MKTDMRLQCPECGIRTWRLDYREFMLDHDRPDGRACKAGARRIREAGAQLKALKEKP